MKKLIMLVVLLAACATVVIAYPTTNDAPKDLSLTILEPCVTPVTDSASIRATWQPVLDRRGGAVSYYNYRFLSNSIPVINDSTPLTTVTVQRPCPQYGDSLMIQAEVWAVDNRGNQGTRGISNTIKIKTPDLGPVAPVITIDTIAAGETPLDSIRIYAFGTDTTTVRYILTGQIYVNETIQFCPILYPTGGTPGLPLSYHSICAPAEGFNHYYWGTIKYRYG